MYLFSQLFKTELSLRASFLRMKQSPENMFFSPFNRRLLRAKNALAGDCFGRSRRSLAMTVRKLSLRAPQCSLTHKRGDCIGRDGAPSQLGNCHCERSKAVSLTNVEIASGKERPRNDRLNSYRRINYWL